MEEKEPLSFTIAGQIREKESGIGVPGLIVQANERYLRYKAAKVTTSTDNDGGFRIIYTEKDSPSFSAKSRKSIFLFIRDLFSC